MREQTKRAARNLDHYLRYYTEIAAAAVRTSPSTAWLPSPRAERAGSGGGDIDGAIAVARNLFGLNPAWLS